MLVQYLPLPCPGKRLVLGADASNIPRPSSVTAADRTAMPMHNIPSVANGSTPITFGWQYSTIVALPESASCCTYVLDQERITSEKTAIQVAVEQLKGLLPLLPVRPLVLFDRGSDSNWLWCQCSGLKMDLLGRVKRDRCFSRPKPARTGKPGTPRKDGNRLQRSRSIDAWRAGRSLEWEQHKRPRGDYSLLEADARERSSMVGSDGISGDSDSSSGEEA